MSKCKKHVLVDNITDLESKLFQFYSLSQFVSIRKHVQQKSQ